MSAGGEGYSSCRHSMSSLPWDTNSYYKKIIIDNSDIYIWKTHFSDWESFLRIIICPYIILVMVPDLSYVISSVEMISRDYFYKVHRKRLFLMKQQE